MNTGTTMVDANEPLIQGEPTTGSREESIGWYAQDALEEPDAARQQQNNSTFKLRDSCDACAASKLKCQRQKPICSRCAKRKIECNYAATKRKGRKSASKPSQSASQERQKSISPVSLLEPSTNPAPPPLDSWFPADGTFSINDYLAQFSESIGGASTSKVANSSPLSWDGLSPIQLPDLMTNGENDFPLLTTSLAPDILNFDFSNEIDTFFTDIGHGEGDNSGFLGTLPFFENSASEPALLSDPDAMVTNEESNPHKLEPGSCCMLRAMAFMSRIFSNSSTSCEDSEAMDVSPSTPHNLLATNQKTIDVVGEILQCSCSQDGFTLVVISIIILRLLERYATVARRSKLGETSERNYPIDLSRQSSELDLPSSAPSEGHDEEDRAYMAAQRVLSELHCVHRLVKRVSTKLQEQSSRSNVAVAIQIPVPITHEHRENSSPFSAGIYDQLNMDIKRRLKMLSKEVIAILRRE